MNKSGKLSNIFLIIFLILLFVYLFFSLIYFRNSFLPNTYINGKNCSFISSEDYVNYYNSSVANYELLITDNEDIYETIKGADIYLISNINESLNDIIDNQNNWLWIFNFFSKNEIQLEKAVAFNTDKLIRIIDEMSFVTRPGTNPGQSAKIDYVNGKYVIEPETYGDYVDRTNLDTAVCNAVANLDERVDLIENKCFKLPSVTQNSPEIISACELANKYIDTTITVNLGSEEKNVVIDKDIISKWICIDSNFNVFFDREQIKALVEGYATTFNTYGKTRSFLTAHGVTEQVSRGDFGWLINNEAEIDDLVRAIKAGEGGVREPICSSTAFGYDENELGNSYVEVDLTNQHMYVWVEGQIVLDSDIVTGSANSSRATPAGTYKIKSRSKNVVLRGDDYATPVSYWMPFNRGIGFHDATWQSAFGGNRYIIGYGSHGCVNLPLKVAKELYDYVFVGMPVICYNTSAKGIAELTTETTSETTTAVTTKPALQATTQATTQTTTQITTQTTTQLTPQASAQVTTTQTTQITTDSTTEATTVLEISSEAITSTEATTKEVILSFDNSESTTKELENN